MVGGRVVLCRQLREDHAQQQQHQRKPLPAMPRTVQITAYSHKEGRERLIKMCKQMEGLTACRCHLRLICLPSIRTLNMAVVRIFTWYPT